MRIRSDWRNLLGLLRGRAEEGGDRLAYSFLTEGGEEARLTWRELDARARAMGAALQEAGAGGERVVLVLPPGLDFVAAFFGCLYAGAVAVPMSPPQRRGEARLQAILADARPRVVLTAESLRELGGDAEAWREPDLGPGDLAFLQYTSGSTATPKGVKVTHGNLLVNEELIRRAFGQSSADVVVGWLPLYHDMGLIGNVLQPLYSGGRCHLMSPMAFLRRPARWLEAIGRLRATTSGGPSFAYELCLRKVTEAEREGLDLSSWRVAFNGAEPVRAETMRRFAEGFAACGFRASAFHPCYGLAEATLLVSCSAGVRIESERVSCGEPLQTVKVVDPQTCQPCLDGTEGEVWVAGPSVCAGYWERPEETAETFGARLADGSGPFLRTGDLGFLSAGELFLTGRIKDLVILRGRNLHPQDLELTAERSHPDLRPGGGAAFSIDQEDEERLVIVHEVVRHPRSGIEEIAAAVHRAIAGEHGVSVSEVVLIRPETLPRTTSGKVRRRACREAWQGGELSVVGRSTLETFLRERAAAVLGISGIAEVPADQPLTALGLDSLSAAELKADLGSEVPLADLLSGLGIAELASRMADGMGEAEALPLLAAGEGEAPLAAGQKALWFLHRLAPSSAAYNLTGAARVPAETDPAALRRALQALVDRHDALRSTFVQGSGGPVVRIEPRQEVAFLQEDAAGWSEEAQLRHLNEEAFRPFDLERGPVLRAALFKRPEGGFFVLAVHHIVADFWSLAVLARELGALYAGHAGEAALPALELRFADWARGQEQVLAGPRGDRLWEHWRQRLAGVPPLDLPTDRPRPPAQTFHGASRTVRIGPDAARGLRSLARETGGTPFMVLLTGFAGLLSRWSGQEDFVVGTPTAGRDRRLAGLVGYFVNPVPLRADLSGDPSVRELVERLRGTALDAFAHQDFPFAVLAERLYVLRDAGRPPLVQAMLTLQKAPTPDLQALTAFALNVPGVRLDLGGLRLETLALDTPAATLDLTLMAAELDGDLLASLQFNTDLFDAATAERFLGHLGNLLGGMTADPGRRVSELPLLSEAERAQLASWNETGVAWDLERPLHAWIEEAAARTPEAVAVEGESGSLTYGELLDRSGRLASHLKRLGVGPADLVGVSAERSPEMVVGLLGILRAGAAYVPIDPDYPAERRDFMMADSGVSVLLDDDALRTDWEPGPEPAAWAGPESAAYMIYTSGSTGRPKGAVNTHRGIVNRLLWMQETFGLMPGDRVLHKTPASFDVSVWELFWPLMFGARLVLARPGGHHDPDYLVRRIQFAGVTTAHFVPSMLQAFLEEPKVSGCVSMRRVIASGEALPGSLARRFRERLGWVELHNLYGPTEAAVDVTWWPAAGESGERPVPIGRPVANTRIHLVDRTLREVPVGVAGELCIAGVQLARGYWRRPELTAERFVPDPFGEPGGRLYRTGDLARRLPDGSVDFLGRLDHQVKLRGVRVELGEVEAALAACPGVREAVAGVRGTGADARLVAWVVPAPGEDVSLSEMREILGRRLPAVLVPSLFVMLSALPLTPNGKLDRRALPEPEGGVRPEGASYVPPGTEVEEILAGIWQELLGVERVGIDDHFFDLGGHSLLATQLMAKVRGTFGVEVPLAAMFEDVPTVRNLARAVFRHQVETADDDEIAAALQELEGLSDDEIQSLLDAEDE